MDRSKSLLAVAMLSFMVTLSVIGWILHLAAVALGSLYLKDCPKQPYVPIFLVVTGVCTAISQLVTYLRESLKEGALSILCMVFNFLLGLFNICWFITGSVWVYSIYPPNYESPGSQEYCKKSLYLFAFWFINFCYICISLVLACGGLFVLCTCLTSVFKKEFRSNTRSYGTYTDA
ncbi:hypothetical protein MATL_G00167690 [Megalops atlanticus]|uniref:Uncharacterized protein n=1 Tax=Megalops atlanticus TaxID=7932 RepID=A0A9D3PSG9_MEGAT|nr:hypothetical protein MATL_G00167690 [Megalops atlanticus]